MVIKWLLVIILEEWIKSVSRVEMIICCYKVCLL